ncbi:MAG: hypothetical protein ACP5GX_08305 [Anaerolineae bacterium]
MVNRAREIVRVMGYESIDDAMKAIGEGELILLKMPPEIRHEVADWLWAHIAEIRAENEDLGDALEELASGLEFASELQRYPAGADICEMDLPHGWPSYCEKDLKV